MNPVVWLDPHNAQQPFPDPTWALDEPNGLLAVGGCLSPERLLCAYSNGIFPWYDDATPICWWSPNPRTVLYPERLKVSRSLRKIIRSRRYMVSLDQAFTAVIAACSAPRPQTDATWIVPEMRSAYRRLHQLGFAHSVETWQDGQLVGGLYGVALGRMFFGESMFSQASDASKVALACLCAHLRRWRFPVIDCQLPTDHLYRLGAEDVSRQQFLQLLKACHEPQSPTPHVWPIDPDWACDY
jgi:leucyl/phenylalanyl-tRNA--protein transferase